MIFAFKSNINQQVEKLASKISRFKREKVPTKFSFGSTFSVRYIATSLFLIQS